MREGGEGTAGGSGGGYASFPEGGSADDGSKRERTISPTSVLSVICNIQYIILQRVTYCITLRVFNG